MLPDAYGSDRDYDTAMGRPDEPTDGLCAHCERRAAQIERPDGEAWCEACVDNDNERAWVEMQERDFAEFHSGAAPQSVYDATYGRTR